MFLTSLGSLRNVYLRCRFFIIMFGNVYVTNFHKYLFHADMSKQTARRERKMYLTSLSGNASTKVLLSEGSLTWGLLSYINMHPILLQLFVCLWQRQVDRQLRVNQICKPLVTRI